MTELELIKALHHYGSHYDACPERSMCGKCTCGYRTVKDKVNKLIKKNLEEAVGGTDKGESR